MGGIWLSVQVGVWMLQVLHNLGNDLNGYHVKSRDTGYATKNHSSLRDL